MPKASSEVLNGGIARTRFERFSGSRVQKAFTLVEILVAIGIMAILVALLFPQVKRSIDSARTANCLSHLKQLGHGILLYTADHNGTLPPTEEGGSTSTGAYPGPNFGSTVARTAPTWAEYIYKVYLDNDPRALTCPSKPRAWENQSRGNRPDYGYNSRLAPLNAVSKYREGVRLATVARPSNTILLGDSGTPSGENPTSGIFTIYSYQDLHPRHANSTVNVVYLDLHAETIKLDFKNAPGENDPLGRGQFVP